MLTSSVINDPRRTITCNDVTLPTNLNPNNSFFRRRTQQSQQQTSNGRSDKSSLTKLSLVDENSNKTPSTTFSLFRQHASPTKPNQKNEKSTYDNLTNTNIKTNNIIVPGTNFERKSSYPINKKVNRHLTSDSFASDAYDNYSDKNGYDNYPIVRKTITSTMTTSQNEADGT